LGAYTHDAATVNLFGAHAKDAGEEAKWKLKITQSFFSTAIKEGRCLRLLF
jgi:hypothetical protein